MEAKENNQPLTNEVFQITMETFSEDHAANAKAISELSQMIKTIAEKTNKIADQTMPAPTNIRPLEEEIRKGITLIRQTVAEKPQCLTRKFQIILFPEQDRKLFYKIVFGRWLILLATMLLLNNLYKFGVRWNDNKKEIALTKMENNRTRKAWDILYRNGNKKTRALMDETYGKSLLEKKKPQ